jgi:oligosaccharide repeat unit polymerase
MTLLLISTIMLIVVTTICKKNDLFQPAKFYILVYLFLFAIYWLKLCRFQQPWSETTMMLYWGAVIAFIGGGALITFYVKHLSFRYSEIQNISSISQKLSEVENKINWNWFLKVTAVVFFVFVASYLYNFLRTGIIPMFSDNAGNDRFIYLSGSMFMAMAGASGPLVMMLSTEALFVKTIPKNYKSYFALMLIISFSLYFTLVTRMPLVRCFIYMAVVSHYMKKQISFRTLSVVVVAIIFFFLFGAIVRADVAEFSELAMKLNIDLPAKYIAFINPYAYAVNNVWNMDYGFRKFIDGFHTYNFSYGFEFFRGLFFFTQLEGLIQSTFGFDSLYNDSIIKIQGLNTVIYIWHFYKDFGIAGLFAVSFFLGAAINLFYYNTLFAPTHMRVAFLSMIISMIAFSCMVPLWSFWNIYYETAILLIAHKSIKVV